MTGSAIVTRQENAISTTLQDAGQHANHAAAGAVFADYRSRKADNTLRRQDAALALFSEYLAQAAGSAPTGEALAADPGA